MKNTLYIFIAIYLLSSCKESIKKTITFNTGFPIIRKHTLGSFKEKGEELIYFVDLHTGKKVSFFNNKGEKIKETPLKELQKNTSYLYSVTPVTLDSIIANESYNNTILSIDGNGNIKNKIKLDTVIPSLDSNFKYELDVSIYGSFFLKNKGLILNPNWRYQFSLKDDTNLSSRERTRTFYYKKKNLPYFLKIKEPFNQNKIKVKFGIQTENLYFPKKHKSIEEYDSIFFSNKNYLIIDEKLYVKSVYSNKIYISDTDFNIEDSAMLNSKYTKIGTERVSLTREKADSYINNRLRGGIINQIFYNKKEEKYYVTLLTKISLDFFKEKNYRPWVLQTYNKDFKLIKETPFLKNKYKHNILNLEDGIYIEKNTITEIDNYEEYKVTFEKYSY